MFLKKVYLRGDSFGGEVSDSSTSGEENKNASINSLPSDGKNENSISETKTLMVENKNASINSLPSDGKNENSISPTKTSIIPML